MDWRKWFILKEEAYQEGNQKDENSEQKDIGKEVTLSVPCSLNLDSSFSIEYGEDYYHPPSTLTPIGRPPGIPGPPCSVGCNLTPYRDLSSVIHDNIWSDGQCSNVNNFQYIPILQCIHKCWDYPQCTAVNYGVPDQMCILRACPKPIADPELSLAGYKGYEVIAKNCKYTKVEL